MKILLCTSTFENGLGGVPAYARDFVDAFRNYYEFVVVTGSTIINDAPCKIYQLHDQDISIINARKLLSIVDTESPDIVVNSSFLLLSVAVPFFPDNIKVITVSHFVNGYYARVAGYNADYVDKIISLSSFGAKSITKTYQITDSRKMEVVFNFMAPLEDSPDLSKSDNKTLSIVFPGGSNRKKSADIFLKSILKLLKTNLPFKLYWIGGVGIPGQKWKFTLLKSISQILPKDSRIVHLGSVSREEAQNIMKQANIFVLPSRGEGFPISLIEAMRGRCIPVISDAKHGALDVLQNGKNGFVTKQGNYIDLYNCLVNIIQNHQYMKNVYDESYNTYIRNLERSVWVEKMKEILQKEPLHNRRMLFSTWRYRIMQWNTKIYTFNFFIIKEKMRDNVCTMIVYRIIFLLRNKY